MANNEVFVKMDADTAKLIDGITKAVYAFKGMEQSVSAVRQGAKQAEGGMAQLSNATVSVAREAAGMVTAYLSISGAQRAYDAFANRLKEIRELMSQIAEGGTKAQTSLEHAVPKLGLKGPEGFRQAQRMAASIVAGTGASPAEATAALEAAGIEVKGGPSEKFAAAQTMAAFAKGAGLKMEETAGLWDFLDIAGARTPDQIRAALSKIGVGARAGTAGVGEFAGPLLKAAPELAQLGFGADQIIGLTAQAMESAGGLARPSAKMLAGLADTLRDPKVVEVLKHHAGLKKRDEITGPAALAELERMMTEPRASAQLEKALGADRAAQLGRFLAKSEVGAGVAADIASGATVAGPEAWLPQTALGSKRMTEARMEARALSLAERAELKAGIDREAEQLLQQAKAGASWRDWLSNVFTPGEMQLSGARALTQLQRLGSQAPTIDGETPYSDPSRFTYRLERRRRLAGAPEGALVGPHGEWVGPSGEPLNLTPPELDQMGRIVPGKNGRPQASAAGVHYHGPVTIISGDYYGRETPGLSTANPNGMAFG